MQEPIDGSGVPRRDPHSTEDFHLTGAGVVNQHRHFAPNGERPIVRNGEGQQRSGRSVGRIPSPPQDTQASRDGVGVTGRNRASPAPTARADRFIAPRWLASQPQRQKSCQGDPGSPESRLD